MNKRHIVELVIFFIVTATLLVGILSFFPTTTTYVHGILSSYEDADKQITFQKKHLEEIHPHLKTGLDVKQFTEQAWCINTRKTKEGYEVIQMEIQENEDNSFAHSFFSCSDTQSTLHTHPPIIGTAYPGGHDIDYFTSTNEPDCIAQGRIKPENYESGDEISGINCFNQELEQLKTKVQ